jgi:RNA polymerase sigma-70 factor (ECF subfamily)
MTDDLSDAQLLERHGSGHTDAFEALVRLHQGPLLRHAFGLLGPGRPAEDVVQEAFIKLAQQPPSLHEEVVGDARAERAALASWLHKVTRNLCMDLLRSESRRKRREQEVAPGEAAGGGFEDVDLVDTKEAVTRSLERLPQDQREVLVLRLLGEKTYKEISSITGKKVGTVGWLVSVGLKALASELTPLLGGAPGCDFQVPGLTPARGELS